MLLVAAGLLAVGAPRAEAHSKLTHSSPANGARLDKSPSEVLLVFAEDMQALGTEIAVVDASGTSVAIGSTVVVGPKVTAAVSATLRGSYQVRWRATSADGHPVSGTIDFVVAPATASPSLNVAPSDSTASTATTDQRGSTVLTGVLVAGGVVVLLVVILFFVRRSRRTTRRSGSGQPGSPGSDVADGGGQ